VTPDIDYDLICRVAKRRAQTLRGQRVEWEDLAQETILHALKGRKSIDGPMTDLLRRDMFNSRSVSRQHRVSLRELAVVPRYNYLPLGVQRAISELTPRQSQVLYLIYWQGHSNREAAKELGVNESRVGQLNRAILKRFRAALTNRPAQVPDRAGR